MDGDLDQICIFQIMVARNRDANLLPFAMIEPIASKVRDPWLCFVEPSQMAPHSSRP